MTEGRDHAAARCTGECCRVFTMQHTADDGTVTLIEAVEQLSEPMRRLLVITDTAPEGADPDRTYFACRQWDARTGRCLAYADRPSTCSLYPYDYCRHCGARSAAEASGVALMRVDACAN